MVSRSASPPRESSSRTITFSRPGHLVCPACESGELQPRGGTRSLSYLATSCDTCGCAFNGAVLRILEQIVALSEALGKHACEECYHPEMRLLPDGTFHCLACRSEVRPITGLSPSRRLPGRTLSPPQHKRNEGSK